MIIEIDGIGRIQVDDAFADLTTDQQNAYIKQIASEYNQQQQQIEPVKKQILEKAEDELDILDNVKGVARSFAQGLTFGFADELEAGTLGKILDYDAEDIRESLAEFRKEAPIASFVPEMAGALVPSLAAGLFTGGAGTAAGIGSTAARITPSLTKTALRGAGTGAAYGGAYGVGTAEGDLGQRLVGGATGATFGGVLGSATPLAIQGIGFGMRKLSDALSMGGTKRSVQYSDEKLLQALQRDGLSPQEASKKLADARALGAEDVLIADLGENLQGLGFASQAIPNESRKKVAEKLAARNIGQADIIADDLATRSKLSGPFSVEYIDDLVVAQEKAARPAYKEAYKKSLPAISFKDFFTGPRKDLFVGASKEGKKIAQAQGQEVADLGKVLKDEASTSDFLKGKIPTQYLHSIKRGLDSIIDKNTDKVTGKVTPYGRAVIQTKNEFNKKIGNLNPAYAQANKTFSDSARLQQAYHAGFGFKNKSVADLNKFFKNFNNGEKEAFRVGMIANIKDRAETLTSTRNFIPEIFGSKKKQKQLRLAFPGGEDGSIAYKQFNKIIELEKTKVETKNRVLGGSQTARNLRELEESGADVSQAVDLMSRLSRGDVLGATGQIIKGVGARVGGMNPERANEIAKRLFTASPSEQQAYLQRLQGVEKQLIEDALKRIKQQQVTSAFVGGQAGSLITQ